MKVWLPLLLALVFVAACQAQSGAGKMQRNADSTASNDFFDDPRLDQALKDITRSARERCNSPQGDTLDPCTIDRVTAVLPYADRMAQFCGSAAETIDRYFCVVLARSAPISWRRAVRKAPTIS